MEEALVAYLLGLAPLTALVSTRIYWMRRPQGQTALPTVVLQRISTDREVRNDGPDGLIRTTIQFNVYANDLNRALDVGRVLIPELEGASFIQGDVEFKAFFVDTERHAMAEPPMPPELPGLSIDMSVWYRLS